MFMMTLMVLAYFLPALIAVVRGHNNVGAIFVTDLLLGWTVLGWLIALIWSCTDNIRTAPA